jgi:hypothetical protein
MQRAEPQNYRIKILFAENGFIQTKNLQKMRPLKI